MPERALLFLFSAALASAQHKVNFEKDIQPVFEAKCYACHGPEKQLSGFRLDKRQNALRGGDYGKVIVPGDSASSKMIDRLTGAKAGMQMPPAGPLEPHEIDLIKAWIDQGCDYGNSQTAAPAKKAATAPALEALLGRIVANDLAAIRATLAKDKSLAQALDANGSTALMHAAGRGSLEAMRLLLGAGAPVNIQNKRGATALIWSLADPAKVKLLLEHGAEVNVKTGEGRTPLHIAAQQTGLPEVVRMLLARGASVSAQDLGGAVPLHNAAGAGGETNVKLLLDAGAKVNAESASGMTPLIQAAMNGANPVVRLLLARGADPKIMTKRKVNALAHAAYWGDIETMKALLAKGAPAQVHDADGYSPLMFAAYSELAPPEAVHLLLRHGAKPQPGADDKPPSELALERGATELAQTLKSLESR